MYKKVYYNNREALCLVLRVYNVGGKLLNGIKSMYIKGLDYIRLKCVRMSFSELRVV